MVNFRHKIYWIVSSGFLFSRSRFGVCGLPHRRRHHGRGTILVGSLLRHVNHARTGQSGEKKKLSQNIQIGRPLLLMMCRRSLEGTCVALNVSKNGDRVFGVQWVNREVITVQAITENVGERVQLELETRTLSGRRDEIQGKTQVLPRLPQDGDYQMKSAELTFTRNSIESNKMHWITF